MWCALQVANTWGCAGCQFSDFAGGSVVDVGRGEGLAMHGSEFTDNIATSAVLLGEARTSGAGALVGIETCTFQNNTAPHLLQATGWAEGAAPPAVHAALKCLHVK